MNERIRCPHWLRLQIGWLTSVEKCRANGAHGLRKIEAAAEAATAAEAAASALSSHCFCNNDLAHSRQGERKRGRGREGGREYTGYPNRKGVRAEHNS